MKKFKPTFLVAALAAIFVPVILAGCQGEDLKPEPEDPKLKEMPQHPEGAAGPTGEMPDRKKGN